MKIKQPPVEIDLSRWAQSLGIEYSEIAEETGIRYTTLVAYMHGRIMVDIDAYRVIEDAIVSIANRRVP